MNLDFKNILYLLVVILVIYFAGFATCKWGCNSQQVFIPDTTVHHQVGKLDSIKVPVYIPVPNPNDSAYLSSKLKTVTKADSFYHGYKSFGDTLHIELVSSLPLDSNMVVKIDLKKFIVTKVVERSKTIFDDIKTGTFWIVVGEIIAVGLYLIFN